jgi:AcrR family transcriptional regulator
LSADCPGGVAISRTLTISALERESGVARSTVYFYVREGVLPEPSRTAQGRFLFTDDHVRLLAKVEELKGSGLSLEQIRTSLEGELRASEANGRDLPAQERERIRRRILQVATEEFLARGYQRTQVRTIIKRAGVSPQVFYGYFPSKSRLLVDSFGTLMDWSRAHIGPKAMTTDDLGERLLLRISADPPARAFQADVLALARSFGDADADVEEMVQQAWAGVVRNIVADLESVRPQAAGPPPVSLELLAYSLIGALHDASLRATWGDDFDQGDVMRTHLWLWLSALAALSGESAVESQMARYEPLIERLSSAGPQVPPPAED